MDEHAGPQYLDITVFIMSYNRPSYLREMLISVLAQTRLPEEVVILDNGSSNGTKEAVEDLLGPRVRFVGADHNHQSLWNFYRALSMSERKFLTIVHDDDRLMPNFLEATVGLMSSDDELIAVSTNGHRIDEKGDSIGQNLIPDPPGNVLYFKDERELAFRTSNNFMPFPNMVYRNGYPQRPKIREEFGKISDSIFLIDLARSGKMAIINELLYEYRVHGDQDSALLPEDLLQMKEDFILDLFEGRPEYDEARDNIRIRQSRRFIGILLHSILVRKDPRYFFKAFKGCANRHVRLYYIVFFTILNIKKYFKKLIGPMD